MQPSLEYALRQSVRCSSSEDGSGLFGPLAPVAFSLLPTGNTDRKVFRLPL